MPSNSQLCKIYSSLFTTRKGRKGDRDEGDKDEKGETLSVTDSKELNIKAQHVDCSSDCINNSNLISVYFNAQSVVNKLDDLHTMVCSFQPDIIGICESWTNSNILDSELGIPRYETFGVTDQTYTEEAV